MLCHTGEGVLVGDEVSRPAAQHGQVPGPALEKHEARREAHVRLARSQRRHHQQEAQDLIRLLGERVLLVQLLATSSELINKMYWYEMYLLL